MKYTLLALGLMMALGVQAQDSVYLADMHKNVGECTACHVGGVDKLTNSRSEINKACEGCHGDAKTLGKKDLEKHALSVHDSHLVDVGCTSCHAAHSEPVMVCTNCHAGFAKEFKMPGLKGELKSTEEFPAISEADIEKVLQAGPTRRIDLAIVGGGSSGLNAAIQAKMKGIDNMVIFEKMPFVGGNSQLSAGGYAASETIIEALNNIRDSNELFFNDTMKGGRNVNDPALVHTLVDNSAAGIEWLMALGADMSSVVRNGGHSANRQHRPSHGAKNGPELIGTLKSVAEELKIPMETNSKVVKLVTNDTGAIQGLVVQGMHTGLTYIRCDAVVLASGGFGWNNALVAQYRPDLKGTPSTNAPGNVGEGLRMAKGVGAKLVDMKEIQTFPTCGDGRLVITGTALGAGAILINHDGKRFTDETITRDKLSAAIWAQKDRTAWMVWDAGLMDEVRMLRGLLPIKIAHEIKTWDDVREWGLDPKVVQKQIEIYNASQKAGKDSEFGRKYMARSLNLPLYIADTRPAIHHTMGGVAITTKTQVRNEKDEVIPGLFAAGEVTGGVHGANRLGGNAIAETVVFGRIAGASAAEYIHQQTKK